MLDEKMTTELIAKAIEQLAFSYTPYSNFKVGAALLSKNGTIYTGCNIENAAYTPTNCAERTAFFKAVSEGCKELQLLVICSDSERLTPPCGACRQVMAELAPMMKVILVNKTGQHLETTVEELLPLVFSNDYLLKKEKRNHK